LWGRAVSSAYRAARKLYRMYREPRSGWSLERLGSSERVIALAVTRAELDVRLEIGARAPA
jgi:hypothetical protein